MAERLPIPAAELLSSRDHLVPGQLRITEFFFQVPLDYAQPDGATLTLFARRAVKHEVPPAGASTPTEKKQPLRPYMVYLEGGPGFGNREPQDHPLVRPALARGYQMLLLDHRGTGLSTAVSADVLDRLPGGPSAQAAYLRLMRQDNTVRDCEAVRRCLTSGWDGPSARWSLFGQSYGGFVSLSYLSMHPEGLIEVFLTGGLAPVGKSPDDVYRALFPRIAARSDAYYRKFPEDVQAVWQIAAHIEHRDGKVALPAGGYLTVSRLLTLGIAFGGHGGFDTVHATILRLKASLDQFGTLTRAALAPLETSTPFDTNIIYAILHEAIYCDGPGHASNWAAYRAGQAHPDFSWLKPDTAAGASEKRRDRLNFSGENVFPFHFDTYPELMQLKEVAELLAGFDEWPRLYDEEQLARNEVPVYAASYTDDMYVDANFARDTANLVKGTKVFETNVLYHSALRAKTEEVLHQLFALRDDVID